MRILVAVTVSIAVVISASSAKNLHVDENSGDSSSSSSEESTSSKDYMKQLQTMCYDKMNSNDAFNALLASVHGVPLCVHGIVDMNSFIEDMRQLDGSTRHEIFPKYCPKIRSALVCLDAPKAELRKCLDANDVVILEGMVNALPDVIDLICKNDGEILYRENANYDVCMSNYSKYVTECAGKVSNETDLMEVSKFGRSQCDELTSVRNCMNEKFNECNGPRIMELFAVFWRALIQVTPCKDFVAADKVE